MSNAVAFLLIPLAAAVVGSLVLWAWSRSRRPVEPGFQEQLRAITNSPVLLVPDSSGALRLTMISDDNFRAFQRTEFVEYRIAD